MDLQLSFSKWGKLFASPVIMSNLKFLSNQVTTASVLAAPLTLSPLTVYLAALTGCWKYPPYLYD